MADPSSGKSRAERYLELSLQQFRLLGASPGAIVVRHITLAGRTVRIEVSAGAMERVILPAFAHLISARVPEPDLVLCAWDSESTATPPLSPGWRIEDYRGEGFISGFNDFRFHTATQFDPIILRMLDMERRCALYWTHSAFRLPHCENGCPLRSLLHEWLRRMGLFAVHGGAVGRMDGGVLLAGASGQGKSNVALACLNSDLRYASDDVCCLSQSPHWTVHSLYCTGRIAADDLGRHPHLRGAESNPDRLDGEKALFLLNEKFGDRLIRKMPLRAVVLPRMTGHGASRVVLASPDAAQKAIAFSTIVLFRWAGRDTLTKTAELLRDLPCYEVQVGASIDEVPGLLAQLLDDLRPKRSPHAPFIQR